jgi:signal transduction histidine kinase
MIGRMRRHGGTAVIASSPDGTEVRLRLPLAAAAGANGAGTNVTGNNGEDSQ